MGQIWNMRSINQLLYIHNVNSEDAQWGKKNQLADANNMLKRAYASSQLTRTGFHAVLSTPAKNNPYFTLLTLRRIFILSNHFHYLLSRELNIKNTFTFFAGPLLICIVRLVLLTIKKPVDRVLARKTFFPTTDAISIPHTCARSQSQ